MGDRYCSNYAPEQPIDLWASQGFQIQWQRPKTSLSPMVVWLWNMQPPNERLPHQINLIPNGCFYLIFYQDEGAIQSRLIRPHSTVEWRLIPSHVETLGVTLRVEWAYSLLGIPLNFLPVPSLNLREIWPHAISNLEAQLFAIDGFAARAQILQHFLDQQFDRGRIAPIPIFQVCRELLCATQPAPFSEILRSTGYSTRYLRQLFQEHIGMSPKKLARIYRFQQLLQSTDLYQLDSANLALEYGYYDQSHFNREFKQLVGLPPSQSFPQTRSVSRYPEHILT